jgi:hypothetical protein
MPERDGDLRTSGLPLTITIRGAAARAAPANGAAATAAAPVPASRRFVTASTPIGPPAFPPRLA